MCIPLSLLYLENNSCVLNVLTDFFPAVLPQATRQNDRNKTITPDKYFFINFFIKTSLFNPSALFHFPDIVISDLQLQWCIFLMIIFNQLLQRCITLCLITHTILQQITWLKRQHKDTSILKFKKKCFSCSCRSDITISGKWNSADGLN